MILCYDTIYKLNPMRQAVLFMKKTKMHTNMKHTTFLVMIMLLLSTGSFAQSTSVQSKIINQVLNHPDLMQYHRLDPTGMPLSLYVASESIGLEGLSLTFRGFTASIVSATTYDGTNVQKYFLVRELVSTGNQAELLLRCYSNAHTYQEYEVSLQEQGGQWEIITLNQI